MQACRCRGKCRKAHPTTIVLVEAHVVVRDGLRLLLQGQPGFSVVGEASDGLHALALIERRKPSVVVMDPMLPGLGGLEVARRVRERFPRIRIVVLSMLADDAQVHAAFQNGVSAYVLKEAGASTLVRAIHEAVAGRRYLSPPLTVRALEEYARKARGAGADPYQTLTNRERQVLHMTAEGQSSASIGWCLRISARTAETHRANAMRKLGLRNRTDLIRYALARGILRLERTRGGGPQA